jgi:tellurite resistance protein TehA-like permease
MSTYWFRPKRFGYGATPCTWQGWAFTFMVVVAAFACAELARRSAPADFFDFKQAGTFWFAVLAAAIIVIGGAYVSHRKTEGGLQWRRGGPR